MHYLIGGTRYRMHTASAMTQQGHDQQEGSKHSASHQQSSTPTVQQINSVTDNYRDEHQQVTNVAATNRPNNSLPFLSIPFPTTHLPTGQVVMPDVVLRHLQSRGAPIHLFKSPASHTDANAQANQSHTQHTSN